MSNYLADVATNIFLVGNVTVKGVVICMVAGSFLLLAYSLQISVWHLYLI